MGDRGRGGRLERGGGGGETGRRERGDGGGGIVEEDNLEGGGRVGEGVVGAQDLVHVRLSGQGLQTLLLQDTPEITLMDIVNYR